MADDDPSEVQPFSKAELRHQRERREWDKARLAGKSPDDLTLWEQQRLAEIEWEEEWEQRELAWGEKLGKLAWIGVAGFRDNADELRRWFNGLSSRQAHFPPIYAESGGREVSVKEIRALHMMRQGS